MSEASDVNWADPGQVLAWATRQEAQRLQAPVAEAREWFTSTELAALRLTGVPTVRANVLKLAQRAGWLAPEWQGTRWRERQGRGGGVEFHVSVLPPGARQELRWRHRAADPAALLTQADVEARRQDALWGWFARQTDKKKNEGKRRLQIILAVRAEEELGRPRMQVLHDILPKHRVSFSTFYAWEEMIRGLHRTNWWPALTPRHRGGVASATCHEAAWTFLRSAWLSPSKPSFEACWRDLIAAAGQHGWAPIPSKKTLERRLKALPQTVKTLEREGPEALERLYPAQQRTRGHFHALEAVNADGHQWDVMVRWPDGEIGRPVAVAFQDLYSGKILSWRVDRSESKELIRLAFGDMVEAWGVPDRCWFDNGRAFNSKWLTGGMKMRFRGRIREEDAQGIMTLLGVEVRVTKPYSGRSKPIERAFGDFARTIARRPDFVGAWTGNSPENKPENYGSRAVDLDVFLQVLADGIAEHNARPGRRTEACRGKLSFDQAFLESYRVSPIRRASEAQRGLWLLAAEAVRARKPDGAVWVLGNRFWAEPLTNQIGQRLVVRFDPQKPAAGVHVYRWDGSPICFAPMVEATGFDNAEQAAAHGRNVKEFRRAAKAMARLEKKLSLDQQIAATPRIAAPEPPEPPRVVRLVNGSAIPMAARHPGEQPEEERQMVEAIRRLRVIRNEEDL